MAAAARRRRTKQQSLPIIHFYEEFIKTTSARNAAKANQEASSASIVGMELASIKSLRRRRPRSMSSDATAGSTGDNTVKNKSSHTLTTQGTASTRQESRVASSVPVSPLTPTKDSGSKYSTVGSTMNAMSKGAKNKAGKTPNTKRLSLYERSQLRLKEREKKIQNIRDELMRECTFRPNTGAPPNSIVKSQGVRKKNGARRSPQQSTAGDKSSSTTPTTATTPTTTASSTRRYWQEFQRSHQQQQRHQASAASSKDGSKTSHTTKSLRFEELYQEGLRKARRRPATEKAEQELRKKRLEEEEMRECTFKPKLYWGKKVATTRRKPLLPATQAGNSRNNSSRCGPRGPRSPSPRRRLFESPPSEKKKGLRSPLQQKTEPFPDVDLSPIPVDGEEDLDGSCGSLSLLRRHHDKMRQRNGMRSGGVCSPNPPLPLEIITTGVAPMSPEHIRPWSTVLYSSRREAFLSPMLGRRALAIEIDADQEKSPQAPRVIFCGTTVAGDSVAAQSQRTEYGSI